MRLIITKLLKNALRMFLARPMLLLGARWYYSTTETKIDDAGVEGLIAVYDGDLEKAMIETEKFLNAIKKEIVDKKQEEA